MPTAEGEFPKDGGDPLYYSEANRFAAAGTLLNIGSSLAVASGTDAEFAGVNGRVLGSFVVNAGSLPHIASIKGYIRYEASNESDSLAVFVSGLSTFNFALAGSAIANVSRFATFEANLGSIHQGNVFLSVYDGDVNIKNYAANGANFGTNPVNNFNTGSVFVIAFKNQYESAGNAQVFWNFQAFRGLI